MNKTLLQLGMKYDDGDQKSDNERGDNVNLLQTVLKYNNIILSLPNC